MPTNESIPKKSLLKSGTVEEVTGSFIGSIDKAHQKQVASQGSLPGRSYRAQTLKAVTKPSAETVLSAEANRDEA